MFLYNPKSRHAFSFRSACFKCRIAFHDYTRQETRPCPECTLPMVNVGHHFRAPKRSAIRKWKALEKYVVEHGMTFDGKDGNGFVPSSVRELNQAVAGQFADEEYFNDPYKVKRSYKARPLTPQFYSNKYRGMIRY
jgi:hypothetical protein